jgi:ribosomal protein S18 acetylase RimI-like enzyme
LSVELRPPAQGDAAAIAALVQRAFRELRSRGKRRVGLGVDSGNPTGAVRLYERVGMEVERRITWYEKAAR